jgi:hypothetical protein
MVLRLDFDDTAYVASHGRARGRGSWAFASEMWPRLSDVTFTPGGMTLTEARRWFRNHLVAQGVTGHHTAYLQP